MKLSKYDIRPLHFLEQAGFDRGELLQGLNRIENTSAAVCRLIIQSAGNFPNIDEAAKNCI